MQTDPHSAALSQKFCSNQSSVLLPGTFWLLGQEAPPPPTPSLAFFLLLFEEETPGSKDLFSVPPCALPSNPYHHYFDISPPNMELIYLWIWFIIRAFHLFYLFLIVLSVKRYSNWATKLAQEAGTQGWVLGTGRSLGTLSCDYSWTMLVVTQVQKEQ